MSNRLPPLTREATNIMIAAVREAGLCPYKAAEHPMMAGMVQEWLHGRWTRTDFVRACGNLLIFNPSLAPVPEMKMRVERLDVPPDGSGTLPKE